MRSRSRRRTELTAGLAAVLLAGLLLMLGLRLPGLARFAAAATTASTAQDVAHPPWYGLQLLDDPVSFSAARTAPRDPPAVSAAAGILVDIDSGRILWQLNADEQRAPASTIKLLTALVVLENFNPASLVTVTPNALFQAWDESRMGLKAGERLSIAELLTGMLTVSANDAADTLAVDTVGLERFVGAMNAQAQLLGLHNTHATTPVGLDDPRMYSSAYDLAVLAAIDVDSFPLFDQIVRLQSAALPASSLHPAFQLDNINLLLDMYPAAVGIKTGYTGDAGPCLVAEAVRDGHRLVSVLLDANYVSMQSRRLLDWGFVQEGLASQLPTPSPATSASPTARG
jgi:serine-type D-Ala-D-Ala carboxypeptidase (penicillin-binding protein 5/6)